MTRYLTLIILSLLLSYGMTGQDTSDYPDSLYRERLDTLSASGISADKKAVIYRLDRKKISGSAVLSAAGGTAADILKSMPSVRIDADGEVSFRGSTGFLVFVDGKQSMLEGTQAWSRSPQKISKTSRSSPPRPHDTRQTGTRAS